MTKANILRANFCRPKQSHYSASQVERWMTMSMDGVSPAMMGDRYKRSGLAQPFITPARRLFECGLVSELVRCETEDGGVRVEYNQERPHSGLRYRKPKEFATGMRSDEVDPALLAPLSSAANPEVESVV
jgi:hypothetical protein